MSTHKNLEIWKQSIDFVTRIYKITQSFPSEEKFGLTNQMRRAAVSIPSNIAEGADFTITSGDSVNIEGIVAAI